MDLIKLTSISYLKCFAQPRRNDRSIEAQNIIWAFPHIHKGTCLLCLTLIYLVSQDSQACFGYFSTYRHIICHFQQTTVIKHLQYMLCKSSPIHCTLYMSPHLSLVSGCKGDIPPIHSQRFWNLESLNTVLKAKPLWSSKHVLKAHQFNSKVHTPSLGYGD